MDNCNISQNPAKSWEAGLGCAEGFCTARKKKGGGEGKAMKENLLLRDKYKKPYYFFPQCTDTVKVMNYFTRLTWI